MRQHPHPVKNPILSEFSKLPTKNPKTNKKFESQTENVKVCDSVGRVRVDKKHQLCKKNKVFLLI